jgi:hypothetical protein
MLFKKTDILIDKKSQATIIKNWTKTEFESLNYEVLDNVNRLKLTLRVPFRIRGCVSYMLITSELEMNNKKNHVVLSINCNLIKPFIFAIVLGILTSVLFLLLYSNLIFFLVMGLAITSISFGMFLYSIGKTSNEFLVKLKETI